MDSINNHSYILYTLLKNIPHKVGCEVGVHTGNTTSFLLKQLPRIEKYYAVDPWMSYKKYDGKMYRKPGHATANTWEKAILMFFNQTSTFSDKLITMRMKSTDAIKHIEDESLDWIFIDANHEYKYIKENLQIWFPKVKINGLISGHDYGNKWVGIKKAVDEFVPKGKLKIDQFYVWSFMKWKTV